MRFSYIYKLLLPAVALFISCPCIAAGEQNPVWSYDDDYTGQEEWGAMKGYEICRDGTKQSPVNISFTDTLSLPPINLNYKQASGTLVVTDKSFIMQVADGGILVYGDKSYILQTIEIHSPNEHKIREKFYPAEIHFIHKGSSGDLLIVAVFADVGNENPAIETMLKHAAAKDKFTVDINSLLPALKTYYSYDGSLPYPPCTENVHWKIIKTPITISHNQLSLIGSYVGRNARLPQPLYIRRVLENQQ